MDERSRVLGAALLGAAVGGMVGTRDCECATALKTALVTAPDSMPRTQKQRLELLLAKYVR